MIHQNSTLGEQSQVTHKEKDSTKQTEIEKEDMNQNNINQRRNSDIDHEDIKPSIIEMIEKLEVDLEKRRAANRQLREEMSQLQTIDFSQSNNIDQQQEQQQFGSKPINQNNFTFTNPQPIKLDNLNSLNNQIENNYNLNNNPLQITKKSSSIPKIHQELPNSIQNIQQKEENQDKNSNLEQKLNGQQTITSCLAKPQLKFEGFQKREDKKSQSELSSLEKEEDHSNKTKSATTKLEQNRVQETMKEANQRSCIDNNYNPNIIDTKIDNNNKQNNGSNTNNDSISSNKSINNNSNDNNSNIQIKNVIISNISSDKNDNNENKNQSHKSNDNNNNNSKNNCSNNNDHNNGINKQNKINITHSINNNSNNFDSKDINKIINKSNNNKSKKIVLSSNSQQEDINLLNSKKHIEHQTNEKIKHSKNPISSLPINNIQSAENSYKKPISPQQNLQKQNKKSSEHYLGMDEKDRLNTYPSELSESNNQTNSIMDNDEGSNEQENLMNSKVNKDKEYIEEKSHLQKNLEPSSLSQKISNSNNNIIIEEKIDFLQRENEMLNKENSLLRLKNHYLSERIKEMDRQASAQIYQFKKNASSTFSNFKTTSYSPPQQFNSVNSNEHFIGINSSPSPLNSLKNSNVSNLNNAQSPKYQNQPFLNSQSHTNFYSNNSQLNYKNSFHNSPADQKEPEEILSKLCLIMQVDSPLNLVSAAEKFNRCIQIIPKLEWFVQSVYSLVLPQMKKYQRKVNIQMSEVIEEISSWKKQIQKHTSYEYEKQIQNDNERDEFYAQFFALFGEYADKRKDSGINALKQINFSLKQSRQFLDNITDMLSMDSNTRDDLIIKTALMKINQYVSYHAFINHVIKLTGKQDMQQAQKEVERVFQDTSKFRRTLRDYEK